MGFLGGIGKAIGGIFGGGGSAKANAKKEADKAEMNFMISQFQSRTEQLRKKMLARDPNDKYF